MAEETNETEDEVVEEVTEVVENPKNFIVKCNRCQWSMTSSGIKSDIENDGLQEVFSGCKNCGKARKFLCQKCGAKATMRRFKGNAPPKPKEESTEE